jgi:hypothetical protein
MATATLLAAPALAANTYTITQNQSQLNLTAGGTILGNTLTVTEQQANATTKYNGTVQVGFNGSPAPSGAIDFPGGSAASAVNPTGFLNIPLQFTPGVGGGAGTAAANYGVNIAAPIGIQIPSFTIPVNGTDVTLNVGTLQSFTMSMAVRDLDLDVTSGFTGIGPGGVFDANATSIGIVAGFADLNGSLVFDQSNIIDTLAVAAALNLLAGAAPNLGLTVSTNLLNSTVSLGIGTRIDLASLAGASLPNQATTDGTVSFVNLATPSTLVLPVDITLPSLEALGLPPEILDLQLSLAGQLRATGLIVDVPEPSSVVLGAMAVSSLALVIRRRRRAG